MELVFRHLFPPQSVVAGPGEVCLLPTGERLAIQVLEHGMAALRRGPGPCQRLVIDTDARFDDMLAATILERQLSGLSLPPAFREFARYVGMVRDERRPTPFPLEHSLEGIFLAIRCRAEHSLTDPATGGAFLADWRRLAAAILRLAERGADPFAAPFPILMSGASTANPQALLGSINWDRPLHPAVAGFAAELKYLADDLKTYAAEVDHGLRWDVQLPGGPPAAQALVLRRPQSQLFRHWACSQCPPPVDGPYALLAVTFYPTQWVLSTDLGSKVSLKGLVESLQAAEERQSPDGARQDPWSWHGHDTNYQVVAAPRRGTVLSRDAVLELLREWCGVAPLIQELPPIEPTSREPASGKVPPSEVTPSELTAGQRPPGAPPSEARRGYTVALPAACLAVLLAVLMSLTLMSWQRSPAPGPPLKGFHDLWVFAVGVSEYEDKRISRLPTAVNDAEAIADAFQRLGGSKLCRLVKEPRILTNAAATKNEILARLGSHLIQNLQPSTDGLVVISFSGHGLIEPVTRRYIFAPYDFDPRYPSTGIPLTELVVYLKELKCPALLIFDTCHSGAMAHEADKKPADPTGSPERRGLAIMAACAADQKANEKRAWKHGALTLAVLEGIEGSNRFPEAKDLAPSELPKADAGGLVSLEELSRYVKHRVDQLSTQIYVAENKNQEANTYCIGPIAPGQFAISVRPFPAAAARP